MSRSHVPGKVEKVDCDLPACSAVWFWTDRQAGQVTYEHPSNGLRGAKYVPARQEPVEAFTTDDYLWLFECPFCGHAESDPIVPE